MSNAMQISKDLGDLQSLFAARYVPATRFEVERVELAYVESGTSLNRPAEDVAAAARTLAACGHHAVDLGAVIFVTVPVCPDQGCACGSPNGLGCLCPTEKTQEPEERCLCGATCPSQCECRDAHYDETPYACAAE